MRWEFEEKIHVEFWFFSGINFAGTKKVVQIHPYGGLQGEIKGQDFKSVGIICEPGLRVTFMTSATGSGWESTPWRCVQVLEGKTNTLTDGRKAVQIPDLDSYSEPDAPRSDAELEVGFPEVEAFEDGSGWTFGKTGRRQLKLNIRSIRVERIPGGPQDKKAEAAMVVEEQEETSTTPEPQVQATKAAQNVTVRHPSPTTTKKKAKHLPKKKSLSPGSGRKD